jgi:hypothetical protein
VNAGLALDNAYVAFQGVISVPLARSGKPACGAQGEIRGTGNRHQHELHIAQGAKQRQRSNCFARRPTASVGPFKLARGSYLKGCKSGISAREWLRTLPEDEIVREV